MQSVGSKENPDSKKTTTSDQKTKSPSSAANRSSSKRKIKRFRPSSPPTPLTLPQKIIVFLEDNRISPGDVETLRSLRRINDQSQNAKLKKVLNVLFLSTGVALLLSVIGVVVFTSLVNDEENAVPNIDPVSDDVYDKDAANSNPPNHLPLQGDHLTPTDESNDNNHDIDKINFEILIPKKPDHKLRAVGSALKGQEVDYEPPNIRHRNRKDCTLVPMQRGTKLRMLDICSDGRHTRHAK